MSVAGNQLTNAAKWSGNASVDWKAAEIWDGTLVLRADGNYQSRVFFDVHETPTTVDNGHGVANASLAFERKAWTFTGWVTNLFEAKYFTYAIDLSSEGFVYKIRGAPREFGGRIGFKF